MYLENKLIRFKDMPKPSILLLHIGVWLFVLQLLAGIFIMNGSIQVSFIGPEQFATIQAENATLTLLECVSGAMLLHLLKRKKAN